MTHSIPQDTFTLLQKDFDFPEKIEEFNEIKAIEMLTKIISFMLDREFEKLLQVCYRIDLGEEKLKHILHLSEPDAIASDLAKALWERQKMKVEIRRKYSGTE